jgi:hypothetical protein
VVTSWAFGHHVEGDVLIGLGESKDEAGWESRKSRALPVPKPPVEIGLKAKSK